MQSRAGDLGRIDNARLDEIFECAGLGVESEIVLVVVANLPDYDRTFVAGIARDLAQRLFGRAANDVNTDLLIAFRLESGEDLTGAEQCNTTARNDAFFDGCTGCMQSVFDTRLLFLHLSFGSSTDLDDGNTAGEFGQAFLQLFTIVVRSGLFDLSAKLLNATFDGLLRTATIDESGVVLVHSNAFGAGRGLQGAHLPA